MQALFLVGEQRSGSNLLRLMISNTHEVAAPHPPHILQRIDPYVPVHQPLSDLQFDYMVDVVCELVEKNPVPWLNTVLDRNDVKQRCREKHVIAIYGAVMDIYAESNGAKKWMCKSMQNIRWARHLNNYFQNNKYIYLHRDPRDVALSFSKAVIGEKHPYFSALQWKQLQRLCLDARAQLPTDRFFTISYDQLINDTESTLRNLCGFLHIEFRREMMHFYESEEARNTAASSSLWENVAKPIMHHNTNKFLKELTQEQICIIESIAGIEMDELGYRRMYISRGEELQFTPKQIEDFRRENERLKQEKSRHSDPEDLRKRRTQEAVLEKLGRYVKEWGMSPQHA